MDQADPFYSIISPEHDNPRVYRSTPACERNCPDCEVTCAVMHATIVQLRRELHAAEQAWLSYMPGPARAH